MSELRLQSVVSRWPTITKTKNAYVTLIVFIEILFVLSIYFKSNNALLRGDAKMPIYLQSIASTERSMAIKLGL